MKVASLLPEDEKLKIELYGELATLQRQGTELKNEPPQAQSEWVQMTMVVGAGFVQDTAISILI